ncbi:MAG: uL15 family ribosomal protein [Thermoproteota archaeon]|nr:uL15 family ribosomal protein [Thermoproteota archaeon]
MPHKERKVRKKRGSRTHGYGTVGQHRGGGQRGGHGKAGYKKHKWTYTVKYTPERFGKHGFTPPKRRDVDTINLDELDMQVEKLLKENKAKKTKEGVVVDLNQLGYDKLLGGGKVTQPFIIRVKSWSQRAAQKINEVGGKILKPD